MRGVLHDVGVGAHDCIGALFNQPPCPFLLGGVRVELVFITPVGEGHHEVGTFLPGAEYLCVNLFLPHPGHLRPQGIRPTVGAVAEVDKGDLYSAFFQYHGVKGLE